MSGLPKGYTERPCKMEDAGQIAAMVNAYAMATYGRAVIEEKALVAQMQMPGLELESDTRLVLDEEEAVAAFAYAADLREPHVQVNAMGTVRCQDQGRGIGRWLADWIEERARQAIPKAPDGARVSVMQSVDDREASAKALLAEAGYEIIRHFWRMVIDLDAAVPVSAWPEGIEVTAFDPATDLRAAMLAGRDAFRDHWGHIESPYEEEALKRFRHRVETNPDFDPSLWFLAREGDEIVGNCYVNPRDGTDRKSGYVESLGVRPPWRRQGVGLALLLRAFSELRMRGFERCALHVDSESLTGATKLYERAGMRVAELNHALELELRDGEDLSRRS